MVDEFFKILFFKKGQKCISLILIGVYMFSIPYNISYLRAYLMLFLPMIFGKWLNQLDIFSFLTVGMLMYNPYLVYNLSFIGERHGTLRYNMLFILVDLEKMSIHKIL